MVILMYYVDDTRYRLGWLSVFLFIGIAMLLGYSGLGLIPSAGTFSLGVGLTCIILAYSVGEKETALAGFGLFLTIIGVVVLLVTFTEASLTLVVAGVAISVALAGIIGLLYRKKSGMK